MQRQAIKRLPAAHLALMAVSLAGMAVIVWSIVDRQTGVELTLVFARTVQFGWVAADCYLTATALYSLARFLNVAGGPEFARRLIKPTIACEGVLVLASFAVLIRGYSSRGLLAGLDMLLPAVVVVAVMSIAVAMATRHESTHVDPVPSESQTWFGAMFLVRIVACVALVAILGYLELQPLPNTFVQ